MSQNKFEYILWMNKRLYEITYKTRERLVVEKEFREHSFSMKQKVATHKIIAIVKTPKRIHARNIDFV